jgi:hypothetical protein
LHSSSWFDGACELANLTLERASKQRPLLVQLGKAKQFFCYRLCLDPSSFFLPFLLACTDGESFMSPCLIYDPVPWYTGSLTYPLAYNAGIILLLVIFTDHSLLPSTTFFSSLLGVALLCAYFLL